MRGRAASVLAPLLVLAIHAVVLREVPVDLRPETRTARSAPAEAELRAWAIAKRAAIRDRKWPEAKELALRLLEFSPTDHTSLGDLAEIERELGNDAAESEAWERYLKVAPVPVHACPDFAFSYRRQGRMKEYLDACERCLSFNPKNSDNLFCVGHASERLGLIEKAREAYRRGLEVAPDYPDLALGLARIELRAGRLDEAARRANQALAIRPGDREALELLKKTGRAPASAEAGR